MRKESKTQLSEATQLKAEAAKQYIERRYTRLLEMEREKKENWESLFEKMRLLNLDAGQRESIKQQIIAGDSEQLRVLRSKPQLSHYESIKLIGRGAFGEVRLCRCLQTGEPVAIKRMRKDQMIAKNKVIQVRE